MSTPSTAREHPSTGEAKHEHEPASIRTYLIVAGILTVVTALEYGVIQVRRLAPVLVPLLITLSAGKFALVVLFFMHLRYEARAVALIFVGSLTIALGIAIALTTLTGQFLMFRR